MNTKQKIFQAAMTLFSQRGFESVSVRDISSTVGVRESALYRHYKNKLDIYNCIVTETSQRLEIIHKRLAVPQQTDNLSQICSFERLQQTSCNLFLFYLKDDVVSKFRKILTIEQYSNLAAAKMYRSLFVEKTIEFQREMFQDFIDAELFVKCDAYVTAIQFYAPIFMLLSKYDMTPEKEVEALVTLRRHVEQFSKNYIVSK